MNAESVYTADHPAVIASLEAMSFGRKSWEATRDECYAWKKVRDNLDPGAGSNVGQRYIYWQRPFPSRRKHTGHLMTNPPVYRIKLSGPWGTKSRNMPAPDTLQEARVSLLLAEAAAKRDSWLAELVAEYGEPKNPKRDRGLAAEILKVLQATPEGRSYCARVKDPGRGRIRQLMDSAAAYEYDAWSRSNSFHVHMVFAAQPDRLELLKRAWTGDEAIAEVKRRNAEKRPDPRAGKKLSASSNEKRARLYHAKSLQQVEAGDKLDEDGLAAKKDIFMASCRDAWQEGKFDEWHWEFLDEVGKTHKLDLVA